MFKYIEHDIVYDHDLEKCYTIINKIRRNNENWYVVRDNNTHEISTVAEGEVTLDKQLPHYSGILGFFLNK